MTQLLAYVWVDLPSATVVDVGTIKGNGWACVEQNAAWGTGIYGCQLKAVLLVVLHTVEKAEISFNDTER